jgi:calcium-dependent protein kinase
MDYDMSSDVLGSGANGDVRLATSKRNSSQKVAVKSFRLNNMSKDEMSAVRAELRNYLTMDHPHIARLFDVYESKDHLHLVMECLDGGDAFDRIAKMKKMTEQEASKTLRQMLLSLSYMHSHGYVHRDVKLENFVYDADNSDHLKLIDFGFSAVWDASSREKMHEAVGTLSYCAPEVLLGSYTSQCDLWSLGVVAYIVVCGRMPFFGNDQKQMRQISAGIYQMDGERWADISSECKDFIRSLLQVDPHVRLSAQAALEHPWIAKSNMMSEKTSPILESLRQYGCISEYRRYFSQALAWSASNEDQAKVRDHFLALNTSQRGSLTFEELRIAMLKKFPAMEDTEFENICYALDHNHDHTIHYSDFLAAMMGTQISLTQDIMRTAFRRFDVDNSGFITVDDLRSSTGFVEDGIAKHMIQDVSETHENICFKQFSSYLENPSLHSTLESSLGATFRSDIDPKHQNTTVDRTSQKLSWYRVFCVVLQTSFV